MATDDDERRAAAEARLAIQAAQRAAAEQADRALRMKLGPKLYAMRLQIMAAKAAKGGNHGK